MALWARGLNIYAAVHVDESCQVVLVKMADYVLTLPMDLELGEAQQQVCTTYEFLLVVVVFSITAVSGGL